MAQESVPAAPVVESVSNQVPTAVRPPRGYDKHKESSSFIGDAESIDPLNARKDSLKEDDEPVLEDIRQVLNAPSQKKEVKSKKDQAAKKNKKITKLPIKKVQPKAKNKSNSQAKKIVKHKVKKTENIKSSQAQDFGHRNNDDPDLRIEKTFHNIYQKYNSVPTSVEEWTKAAQGRMAEIYFVMKGDTLWSISQTFFGDPLFWPKIWAINKQGILNPHFIVPGMKIRFYPGDNVNIPTLAVGEEKNQSLAKVETQAPIQQNQSQHKPDNSNLVVKEKKSPKGSDDEGPDESDEGFGKTESGYSDRRYPPTPIPDSLPLHRNEQYYGKPRLVLVKFDEDPKSVVSYANSIIFTDKIVVSDFSISEEESATVQCRVGNVIRNIKFKRKPMGEYTILQPLDVVKIDNDFSLRPYKIIGKVKSLDTDKVKILDCQSALTLDDVYVPTELVNSLKTTKKIENVGPSIIGGPEARDQSLFMNAQFLYMNFANKNVEVGQVVDVKSLRTESVNAKLKVLDKTGSFGIGVVTEMYDNVRAGDVLLLNE